MSQQELLNQVVRVLNKAEIPYMITGSIASSLYGEPRSSHGIDLVIAVNKSSVDAFMQAFSNSEDSNYYLPHRETIIETIEQESMFNLIDMVEGDKIDFWILTNTPFDKSRFQRRRIEKFDDIEFFVSTPEDTILAKLHWAKLSGGSEKQFGDAKGVYEVQYPNLNLDYLEIWAEKLDVKKLWERLKSI